LTDEITAEREREKAFAALERSNVDLEQFAYAASHDLQEPLRTVTGFTTLLARRYRENLDEEAREFIDFIAEGCNRLKNLIDDLLAYSRIDRADETLGPASGDEALDDALASLQRVIGDSRAVVLRGEHLPRVGAPLSLLSIVFQNLLENAVKFRSADAPHIVVGAERDGVFWRFRVEDNGIGVAPEYYERIFRLFHRLHARSEYEGTGIGLSMCKKIVERYGGRIWVETGARGGSVFLFTLPALED
jgi:light-regulated signal transduction histidine kinase (bacteriophytochrome)